MPPYGRDRQRQMAGMALPCSLLSAALRPCTHKLGGMTYRSRCPLYSQSDAVAGQQRIDTMCHIRIHAANAKPFLSVLALHRFVREPLELDHKWMPHLTLRHYQACGILSRRNPPLSASTSAPKELASRVLMVEHRRLQDQRSRESVPPALKFSESSKPQPHTLRQLACDLG